MRKTARVWKNGKISPALHLTFPFYISVTKKIVSKSEHCCWSSNPSILRLIKVTNQFRSKLSRCNVEQQSIVPIWLLKQKKIHTSELSFYNLWNINDGVELTKPGDRIGRVLCNFRPVILGSDKVVVDSHEPDSTDLETITRYTCGYLTPQVNWQRRQITIIVITTPL